MGPTHSHYSQLKLNSVSFLHEDSALRCPQHLAHSSKFYFFQKFSKFRQNKRNKNRKIKKKMKSVPNLVLGSLLGTSVLGQNFGLGSSGPTSRHYQDSLPKCGKPRFHHNVNLFFEIPDERKRRSSSFDNVAASSTVTADSTQTETPTRSNGNLNWFDN